MNYQNAILLALVIFIALLALLRTVPRRRWVTFAFFLLPVSYLATRWAAYRSAWKTLAWGAAGALAAAGAWWLLFGRRIPPPNDDTIRVWTKDNPFE